MTWTWGSTCVMGDNMLKTSICWSSNSCVRLRNIQFTPDLIFACVNYTVNPNFWKKYSNAHVSFRRFRNRTSLLSGWVRGRNASGGGGSPPVPPPPGGCPLTTTVSVVVFTGVTGMMDLVGESVSSPRWLAHSLTWKSVSHTDKIRARYLHSNPPTDNEQWESAATGVLLLMQKAVVW